MNFDDYKNKLNYPQKKDFTVRFYYKAGEVVARLQPGEEPTKSLNGCVSESVVDTAAYNIAQEEYRKRDRVLREAFIVDILHDFGLPDNEFTRKMYDIAYAEGHSNGYSEIYTCFENLASLDAIARKVYGK